MSQNTPNNPFAGNSQNQGQEGAQANAHSSSDDDMASNAYFANQQSNAMPDLMPLLQCLSLPNSSA